MKPYYEDGLVTIFHGDCRDIIPSLPPIDLVITSPPYLSQRTYGGSYKFIWNDVVPIAIASIPDGDDMQILVNLGLVHNEGEVITYWDELTMAMRLKKFRLFGWYVWDQGSGLPGNWNGRLAPSHEFIFHYNKTSIRPLKIIPTLSSSQLRKKSSSRCGLRRANGVVERIASPEKVGQPFKIPDSVIRICREMRRDLDHPARFPLELPSFLIQSFPSKIILDPFCGSGTTLRAAKNLMRKVIGIDIEEKYCEMAARRCMQEVLNFGGGDAE